jgi:hypothetical protein
VTERDIQTVQRSGLLTVNFIFGEMCVIVFDMGNLFMQDNRCISMGYHCFQYFCARILIVG